jgi:hypothetical protein
MSLQKQTSTRETRSQEMNDTSAYEDASFKISHTKSYEAASETASQTAPQTASRAAYQAALECFTRLIWNSISTIPTYWNKRNFIAQYKCLQGLTFGFHSHQNKCSIEISLVHLSKDEIITLLKKGKLHDELLTLYELAHLPFAEYGLMNIDGLDFDIIDYVKIRLDLAINPKDHRQYLENWEFMISRAQIWGDLKHTAADFLEGLKSLRRG